MGKSSCRQSEEGGGETTERPGGKLPTSHLAISLIGYYWNIELLQITFVRLSGDCFAQATASRLTDPSKLD